MAGKVMDYDDRTKSLDMIVVMGETGTGKSHFINKLAGSKVTPDGDGFESCTIKPSLPTVPWLTFVNPQVPPSASLLLSRSDAGLS